MSQICVVELAATVHMCVPLQEEGTTVIVSVSPQSRASLAEATGLDSEAVLRRLTAFFTKLVSQQLPSLQHWQWTATAWITWEAQHCFHTVTQ